MTNAVRRLIGRIGRRGSFLLFLALLDTLFGWSVYIDPTPISQAYDTVIPARTWGIMWFFVGLVCLVQAFARLDRIGFTSAVALKIFWASMILYSWVIHPVVPREWAAAVIWYAFAGVTAIVSYWPEHRPFNLGDFNGDN